MPSNTMKEFLLLTVFLVFSYYILPSSALVTTIVNATTNKVEEQWVITHTVATFSPQSDFNITTQVILPTDDQYLCTDNPAYNFTERTVLALRGGCSFYEKAQRAQNYGASAVIVGNIDDDLFIMGYAEEYTNITIPSIMIRRSSYNYVANITNHASPIPEQYLHYNNDSNDPSSSSILTPVFNKGPNPLVIFNDGEYQGLMHPHSNALIDENVLQSVLETSFFIPSVASFMSGIHSNNSSIFSPKPSSSVSSSSSSSLPPFFEGSNYPGTVVAIPPGYRTPFYSLSALIDRYSSNVTDSHTNMTNHLFATMLAASSSSTTTTTTTTTTANESSSSLMSTDFEIETLLSKLTRPLSTLESFHGRSSLTSVLDAMFHSSTERTSMAAHNPDDHNVSSLNISSSQRQQLPMSSSLSSSLLQSGFMRSLIASASFSGASPIAPFSTLATSSDSISSNYDDSITHSTDGYTDGVISPILYRKLFALAQQQSNSSVSSSSSPSSSSPSSSISNDNAVTVSPHDFYFIVTVDDRGAAYLASISIKTIRILLFAILLAPLLWILFIIMRWIRFYWGFRCVQELTSNSAAQLPVCTYIRVSPITGAIVWGNDDDSDDDDDFDLAAARALEDRYNDNATSTDASANGTPSHPPPLSLPTPPIVPTSTEEKTALLTTQCDSNTDLLFTKQPPQHVWDGVHRRRPVQLCPDAELFANLSSTATVSSLAVVPFLASNQHGGVNSPSQFLRLDTELSSEISSSTTALTNFSVEDISALSSNNNEPLGYNSFDPPATHAASSSTLSTTSVSSVQLATSSKSHPSTNVMPSPSLTTSTATTTTNDFNFIQVNSQNFYEFRKPKHHGRILNDSCHICLTKFITGDSVKVLGCFHAFHCGCIDQYFSSRDPNGSVSGAGAEGAALTQEMYIQMYLTSNYDFDELLNEPTTTASTNPNRSPTIRPRQSQPDNRTAGQSCPVCRSSILYANRLNSIFPKKWWISLFEWLCLCSCCCRRQRRQQREQSQLLEPVSVEVSNSALVRNPRYTYQYNVARASPNVFNQSMSVHNLPPRLPSVSSSSSVASAIMAGYPGALARNNRSGTRYYGDDSSSQSSSGGQV